MSFVQAGYLTLFSFLLAGGQILLKKAAERYAELAAAVDGFFGKAVLLASNYWLLGALAIYGLATILWLFILQRITLSLAYPFVALVFLLVPLGAWLLLGEALLVRTMIGGALIVAGVLVSVGSVG